MSLTKKVLSAVAVLLGIALVSVASVYSHNSACPAPLPVTKSTQSMKVIALRCYGSPAEVLRLEDVEKPTLADNQILVKVRAASVNPLDWHDVRGTPYMMRKEAGFGAPKEPRLGVDFAGTVEAVGKTVTRFHPGDAVFGGRTGAFGEYVAVREERIIALKPANVTFEEAAAAPVAALTALQALRDHGHLQPGQKVLINGASGGVGTFAVQIAKVLGAEVTGVCSTRNAEMARSLGADHVIDYTKEDFTSGDTRYDLVVDIVGNHGLLAYRNVLTPEGTLVIVGGSSQSRWIAPLVRRTHVALASRFMSQKLALMLTDLNPKDLALLSEWMETGKVRPVIDRSYPLNEVPAAISYVEEGHARGKVVISVETT
jgi:NADPH:quinone reductase-like Zn-dependent oxidoreductase